MITNKERLEKFIEQVRQLALLAEEVRDRDVYPVSFFSQAFDIANKIQEDLQQIELHQIQFIANQMDERQLQILSSVRQSADPFIPEETNPVSPEPVLLPEQDAAPVYAGKPEQSIKPEVIQLNLFNQKKWIDLKKMITLNDRFLFCRELFANNENLMYQVLSKLNMEESYDASIDYLQKQFDWNFEDKNVTDFIAILKKRFS